MFRTPNIIIKRLFALTDKCTMPLGMEDRRILSGHLRASSSYNYNHGPDRARLNIVNGHGRTGAWVARHRNTRQWLQIDCRQMSIIKGIATQGRREAHQWVKSYTLSYSVKGLRFRPYVAYGRIKVSCSFRCNDHIVVFCPFISGSLVHVFYIKVKSLPTTISIGAWWLFSHHWNCVIVKCSYSKYRNGGGVGGLT